LGSFGRTASEGSGTKTMNVKFTRWIILGVLLVTLAVPAFSQTSAPVHLLVVGQIELKRPEWLKFQLAGPVKKLGLDDLVRAQQPGAKILCANQRKRPIPNKNTPVREICLQGEPQMIKSGRSRVGLPRGGTDPLIPYIISPRRTLLLDDKPLIRWNAVPNATHYTVRLRGPSGVIWQTEVRQTEVRYPGTLALQPLVGYALIVQTDTGVSSTEEGLPGLGFELMAPNEAKRIKAEVEQLTQEELTDEARVLALANLYNGEGLTLAAIEVLQQAIANGTRKTAVYSLLGELYREVRLNLYAKDSYLKAIDLAKIGGDLEAQAEAQSALGEIYVVLKDRTAAVKTFSKARLAYVALEGNESAHARKILEQIATLNP